MCEALDQKYIDSVNERTGRNEKMPALHPVWKEDRLFVSYLPPPLDPDSQADWEAWTERIEFIEEDLHWLLKLPHHKFWCQVVFDETFHRCIDSYLKHAPRSYDVIINLPPNVKERHNVIHKLVFLSCLRMATHKESKESFITPTVFGDILYENFVFDIPMLMDLCALYGADNGNLLGKMISNIFSHQPKYENDLEMIVPTILQVLHNLLVKCGIAPQSHPGSPLKIDDTIKKVSLVGLPITEFQDIIFYLSDTANTLCTFLQVYPKAAKVFYCGEFLSRLVHIYESLVPALNEAFDGRMWHDASLKAALQKKLHQGQGRILQIFRHVVHQSCLQPILDKRSTEQVSHLVEDYLQTMSSILTDRRFLGHLESLYPFAEDRILLNQSDYTIDETRLEFLQDAINEAFLTYGKKSKSTRPHKHVSAPPAATQQIKSTKPEARSETAKKKSADNIEELGAAAPGVTGVELNSLISSVRDLLPDLGDGFIELCLEEFGYDIEKVINAVLEDKLPTSLQELDRNMERNTSELPAEEMPENLLSGRRNVYDNDEFDVFNRDDVDTSRIHRGKKEKAPDTMTALDDKSDLQDLMPLYNKYGSEFRETMYDNTIEYDDEYDDTYDVNMIGADDADSADELSTKRHILILNDRLPEAEDKNEEGSSEENDDNDRKRDLFVEDPAVLREKRAQRQAEKAALRRGGQRSQGQKKYDVKGAAKGEGQAASVLKNRDWKEKHKSTRVHHNRKALSDKKRRV